MTYFKLSIRNAKRSFTDYLLYIVTMTALSAVMEVSNCITITGKSVGFQAVSFPPLITMIQVVLAGYNNTFMLKAARQGVRKLLTARYEKKGTDKSVPLRNSLCSDSSAS